MNKVKNAFWFVLYLMIALFVLFPILWSLKLSLTPRYDYGFIPESLTLTHYANIFRKKELLIYFLNSMKVSLGTICWVLPVALLSAYALARYTFRFRNFLSICFLILPMLPSTAILVPLVSYFNKAGLYNTLLSVIIVNGVFNMPLATWMIKNFINNTPREIEEAAYLDGLNAMQTLFRVTAPMIRPGMVSVVIYIFIVSWNNYTFSYALTSSPSKRVLSQAVLAFIGSWGTDWGGLAAIGICMIAPPVLLFLVFQKSFVAGLFGQSLK